MNKKSIYLSLILILIFTQISSAQVSNLLFLNQVIASAVENNPDIQQKRLESGLSVSEIAAISSSQLNPFFTFDWESSEGVRKLGIAKTFELGALDKKQLKIAKVRKEIEKQKIRQQILNVKRQTRNAYTLYYIDTKKLDYLNSQLNEVKAYLNKNKNISSSKFAQFKLLEQKLQSDIKRGLLAAAESKLILEELMGEPLRENVRLNTPNKLPKELQPLFKGNKAIVKCQNPQDLIDIAHKNRPEVLQNLEETELAKQQEKLARAKRIPLVIFEAGWKKYESRNEEVGYINGDIELPILHRNQDEIKAAKDKQISSKDNLKNIKEGIKYEVLNMCKFLTLSKNNLNYYENYILPNTSFYINTIINDFNKGKADVTDFIQVEQINANIQNDYFEVLKSYQFAISDLEEVLGLSSYNN